MARLYEDYRPRTYGEVVGQDKAVKRLQTVAKRGVGGHAFWFSGQSGTGKTTLARLTAAEVASFGVEELDASEITTDRLRRIADDMWCYCFGEATGRAFIINEAHGLKPAIVRKLLTLLESIPPHVVFCFTTTAKEDAEGQTKLFDAVDPRPLLSRCIRVKLAERDLAQPFAMRAKDIAETEGLDGQPLARYVRLAKDCRNNMRAMLEAVEAGDLLGK